MSSISVEFCFVILLLLLVFTVNILHILYLIVYKCARHITSIRPILINSSAASLVVSIWLIPFFYFRSIWSPESNAWRLWSFSFHVVDAVQIYSLLLILTTRSLQNICICFIWLVSMIAYSPLLWLTSANDHVDYLPYRRFMIDVPWWILTTLYCSMYFIPLLVAFVCSVLQIWWSSRSFGSVTESEQFVHSSINEHRQDMAELTDLIDTVINFQLEPPGERLHPNQNWNSSLANPMPGKVSRSLSYQISQHQSLIIFDEFSTSSTLFASSSLEPSKARIHRSVNSSLLFIIACLLTLVHVPYFVLALLDLSALQLSVFIYIHWLGTLFIPLVHLKFKACLLPE